MKIGKIWQIAIGNIKISYFSLDVLRNQSNYLSTFFKTMKFWLKILVECEHKSVSQETDLKNVLYRFSWQRLQTNGK